MCDGHIEIIKRKQVQIVFSKCILSSDITNICPPNNYVPFPSHNGAARCGGLAGINHSLFLPPFPAIIPLFPHDLGFRPQGRWVVKFQPFTHFVQHNWLPNHARALRGVKYRAVGVDGPQEKERK